MRALEIVKLDPSGDSGFGLVAIRITLEIDVLVFERAPQPLDEHVVHPAPATVHGDPDAGGGQLAVKAALVNWLSVLKISGRPKRAKASSSADTQNDVSTAFDRRQASTARLAQSMIATRYRKPWPIGT